ncbi:MAG: glycosyltransferase family 2 protein [Eubacteriales bacterium]|nr:glycosyltransferase family 2 protein [Eubacteriales bacterium]
MTDKLISVVFPVYNDISHLDRSVGAILNQTYRNIEVILTDDGSTDGSGELCDKYAANDSRIRVFHKPNGGHSSAVNYGLERMSGDYVLICDTDDWYEPDACEIALQTIESHPEADAVIFAINRPDKAAVDDPASGVSFEKKKIDCMLLSGTTTDFCHIGFHVESTWAKIIRADVIRYYNVRMPEQLFLAEDAVFCLNLFEHCRTVIFDSHHIYHYEIRFDSFCRKYSNIAVKMLPEILKEQDLYIRQYHENDREYESANNCSVFAWINEAEDHYFFNEQQDKTERVIFQEYKALLNEPVVKYHMEDIRPEDISSVMQKLRLYLYRNPSYPVFKLYKKMKTRKK